MIDTLFGETISSRVQKVVKQRIADAQKEHDEHCAQIDKEAEEKKENHAESMVAKVLGH